MPTIGEVADRLEQFAPPALAEDWDNVGLLVGDRNWPAQRVMTCLTVTPTTVREALSEKAQLIVTHHPLPFQALKSITTATTTGKLLIELIAARIGVYSPHTSFGFCTCWYQPTFGNRLGTATNRSIDSDHGCYGTRRWRRENRKPWGGIRAPRDGGAGKDLPRYRAVADCRLKRASGFTRRDRLR